MDNCYNLHYIPNILLWVILGEVYAVADDLFSILFLLLILIHIWNLKNLKENNKMINS